MAFLNLSINFPMISIILYYVLAIYPHGHAVILGSQGDLQTHDNRNPKASSYSEVLKKRLGPKKFAAWERAESCHRNHLENMPLFCAAIFAGLYAEQRAGYVGLNLNLFAAGWLVVRAAYTANYLVAETVQWSYLRSVLYFVGSFWAFAVIASAAVAVGAQ